MPIKALSERTHPKLSTPIPVLKNLVNFKALKGRRVRISRNVLEQRFSLRQLFVISVVYSGQGGVTT